MDPRPSARTMCVRVRQALVVRGRDEVGSALGRRRSSCWRTLMLRASAVRQLSSAERELPLEEDECARSSRPGESAEGGCVRGGEGRTHRSAGLVTMAAVCEHQGKLSACLRAEGACRLSRKGSRCEGRRWKGRGRGRRRTMLLAPARPIFLQSKPMSTLSSWRVWATESSAVERDGASGGGGPRWSGTPSPGGYSGAGASASGCGTARGSFIWWVRCAEGRRTRLVRSVWSPRRAPVSRRCRSRADNLDAANSHLLLLVHSASSSRSQTHSHSPSEKHRSATRPRAAHRASCRALPGIAAALAQARLALSMLLLSTTLSQIRQRSANEEQTMQGATRNDEREGIT